MRKNYCKILKKVYNIYVCISYNFIGTFVFKRNAKYKQYQANEEVQMKKLYITLLAAVFAFAALTALTVPAAAVDLNETSDLTQLVTSNYKDAFMTIDTDGDQVKISGVFKDDLPNGIYFPLVEDTDNHLYVQSDGRFSGDITAKPLENGYYTFAVRFESRLIYSYTLKYNDGWSVPDNGIAAANAEKLKKITEAPPIAAAYYLSDEADRDEIEWTLEKLEGIVEDVCADETDDYIKAMKLIFWIGDNIAYDHAAAETSVTMDTVAVHNVLERGRTTCAGFANTFSALLEIAGIRSVNLKGAAVAGEITYPDLPTGTENHEFSAFWYEDEQRWVYCDPCWTSNNHYRDGMLYPEINNKTKFFDVTGEAFALNHRIDKAEERFYTQALAALEDSTAETEAEANAPEENEETDAETSENTSGTRPIVATRNEDENVTDKDTNLIPYIILGAVGVIVIAAGIILAVHKNKK